MVGYSYSQKIEAGGLGEGRGGMLPRASIGSHHGGVHPNDKYVLKDNYC